MILFKKSHIKIDFVCKEKLIFSQDPDKNITIIRGDNEVGKTAILRGYLVSLWSTKDKVKYADHISRLNYGARSNNDLIRLLHMEFEETTYIITREAHVPEVRKIQTTIILN